MSDLPSFERKKAFETRDANAVVLEAGDGPLVCLKTVRMGKDFIHHYLVPLQPLPAGELTLIYVDPEDELVDCGAGVVFTLGGAAAASGVRIEAGTVFANPKATFLKARDDARTDRAFAYVDIASGHVKFRQERTLATVYGEWRATIACETRSLSPAEVLEAWKGR